MENFDFTAFGPHTLKKPYDGMRYTGMSAEWASWLSKHLCKLAGETGTTIHLASHLAPLSEIIQREHDARVAKAKAAEDAIEAAPLECELGPDFYAGCAWLVKNVPDVFHDVDMVIDKVGRAIKEHDYIPINIEGVAVVMFTKGKLGARTADILIRPMALAFAD